MPTVEKSVSLKSYNTFAVDVSAQYFAEVCTPEDIRSVLADPRSGQPVSYTHLTLPTIA